MRRLLAFRDAEASGTVWVEGTERASLVVGQGKMDERKTEADCNCVYVQISLAQDIVWRSGRAFGYLLFVGGSFLGLKWDVLLRAHENV